jgi:hypothetical protein
MKLYERINVWNPVLPNAQRRVEWSFQSNDSIVLSPANQSLRYPSNVQFTFNYPMVFKKYSVEIRQNQRAWSYYGIFSWRNALPCKLSVTKRWDFKGNLKLPFHLQIQVKKQHCKPTTLLFSEYPLRKHLKMQPMALCEDICNSTCKNIISSV